MGPEHNGLESIARIDTGEMYEWAITEVWRDPRSNQFYIYSGAGCSCNWAYDDYSGINDLDGPYTSFIHMLTALYSLDLIEQALAWERRRFE